MNKNIRFVLVNTSHPGNIGGTARAIKTMGFGRLFLVNPKKFPHKDAIAKASGAFDLLENAIVTKSLDEALKDCMLIIGTSARMRKLPQVMLTPKKASELVLSEPKKNEIAFVFGSEKYGLNNEDLMKCQYHVRIPTIETFSSLNLASAVQIIAYELYINSLKDKGKSQLHERKNFATFDELENLYKRLKDAMIHLKFLNLERPKLLMERIRHIINRSKIDKDELNLIHGIITAILKLNN